MSVPSSHKSNVGPPPLPPPLPTQAPGNGGAALGGWIVFVAIGLLAFTVLPPLLMVISYFLGGSQRKEDPSLSPVASSARPAAPPQILERPPKASGIPPDITLDATSKRAGERGLPKNLLSLVSVTIRLAYTMGNGKEYRSFATSGTGFVLRKQDSTLRICTNNHCLNFEKLLAAAEHDFADVIKYELSVEFPSQVRRRVTSMSPADNGLDLARLEVDGAGLTDGVDYALVPMESSHLVELGDQVVAVGNPLGNFAGTTTWGRVSSLRTVLDQNQNKVLWIQHDAAVNPGNSGGPLFLEKDGLYYWAGINTRFVSGEKAQGIFFSIAANEVMNTTYSRYPADHLGVVECIRDLYGGRPKK